MGEQKIISFMDEKQKKYEEKIEDFLNWNNYRDIELSTIDSFLICMLALENFKHTIDKYNENKISLEDFEISLNDLVPIHYSSYYSFYDSIVRMNPSVARFSKANLVTILHHSANGDENYTDCILKACCKSFDRFNFNLCGESQPMSLYMAVHFSYLLEKLKELYYLANTEHLENKLNNGKIHQKQKIKQEYSENMEYLIMFKNSRLERERFIKFINIWDTIEDKKGFINALKDALNSKFEDVISTLSQNEELKDVIYFLSTPSNIIEDYNNNEVYEKV